MKKEKIKRRNERFTEDQIEAQRSGFDLERRSSGMSALCFLQKNGASDIKLAPTWSRWRDLNPRPLRPERSALPN